MNLFDLIQQSDYEAAVEDKLITVRDDDAGLRILNYSDAAMYTPGAWENPAVRTCRGLIVDDAWDVVARPWAKFFNHGQAEAGELDLTAPVEVTDKMDGSLGILHLDSNGRRRVATRGSFQSEQAIHATEILWCDGDEPTVRWPEGFTPLVEIIYPGNRIVCDYGDRDELVLLGGVWIESGEYVGPAEAADLTDWEGATAQTFPYATLRDALAAEPRPGMEGLCVRRLDQPHIVKIKQEEYVRLHKIVTGLSERSVWEHMSSEQPLFALLDGIPDELHPWVSEVWTGLVTQLDHIHGEASATHNLILDDLPGGWGRKEYAAAATRHPQLRPYLFNILDGRNPRPSILRTLKPAGDTRARAVSEATA